MKRSSPLVGPLSLLLLSLLPGCQIPPEPGPVLQVAHRPSATIPTLTSVAYSEPTAGCLSGEPESLPAPRLVLPHESELSVETVVREVLARNPSLAQMIAAWKAAEARYPQVTSLDDPMFGTQAAPAAFGSNTVEGGYRLEVSQKLPFCGKLELRGQNAIAEAQAAGDEVEDTRLQLIESSKNAFFDYYLVERAREINRESLELLQKFRQNAKTRYENNLVPQQDVLQADVEIGKEQERQVTLEQMREVAIARLNTLMHLPPDSPLPPAPKEVNLTRSLPETKTLREAAFARRPDLKALADHVAAEQAALALAHKEYYPDVDVMAAYDTFWQERQLQWQVGVRVNLPVRLERRQGAVCEAEARIAQRQAELDRLADQVNLQVQQAAAQMRESSRIIELYKDTILKAARDNVEAAQVAYATGKIPFLTLIEAQRGVVTLRDRYYETIAAYGRRLATLERVIGGSLESLKPLVDKPTAPANHPGKE